jgi:hypothetical protein
MAEEFYSNLYLSLVLFPQQPGDTLPQDPVLACHQLMFLIQEIVLNFASGDAETQVLGILTQAICETGKWMYTNYSNKEALQDRVAVAHKCGLLQFLLPVAKTFINSLAISHPIISICVTLLYFAGKNVIDELGNEFAEIAVRMSRTHRSPPSFQSAIAMLFRVLIVDDKLKKICVEQMGLLDLVVGMMREHPSDLAVQDTAIYLLYCLCTATDLATTRRVGEIGAVSLVLNALRKFPAHARLRHVCASLLMTFSRVNNLIAYVVDL